MTPPTVVIMAAGQGTRMRSPLPKVLHDLCGRPMVEWPIAAAREAGAGTIIVVDSPANPLAGRLADDVQIAIQPEPNGTGGAVLAAAELIDPGSAVLVLSGDVPLVSAAAIEELVGAHAYARAAATVATTILQDPSGYGRVVRGEGDEVERIVETKASGDASAEELAITEINSGIYVFDGGALLGALPRLRTNNAQRELYLPDVLALLRESGATVVAHVLDDPLVVLGINDGVQLALARRIARRAIAERHLRAGVDIVDPDSTIIDAGVELGAGTIVEPFCVLRGATSAGERCRIGPGTTLTGVQLGDEVSIVHSYGLDSVLEDGVSVGPYAYLRPGTRLRAGARIGTFVEVKNSDVGEGSKIPHLSYIGDADVGPGSNLGAGSITANYDGMAKHRTTIGAGVRGAVDTAYVAPVTVGDNAWTAAGSVVTDDVPPGALAIARARQENIEGYDERRRAAREAGERT